MQSQTMRAQRAAVQGGRRAAILRATQQTVTTVTSQTVAVKEYGSVSLQGTARKTNEDRLSVQVADSTAAGDVTAFAGVYDGHGGYAVADWLEKKLMGVVSEHWRAAKPEFAMLDAFLEADKALLSTKAGFMGLGERGIGGSKCGATAAVAMLYRDPKDASKTKLVTANIGDARIVLVKANGEARQLTVDHVPDNEAERDRIERFNPNPKLPLVRYVGGTWRVGGLLALSRAFGDAYLKGSLQFEGLNEGTDGYSSGFGVIAEPYTTVTDLEDDDAYVIVASDGLFAEVERGGGGGLDNAGLTELLQAAGGAPCNAIAQTLADTAVTLGSTDDVTVVVLRLGRA